jgi:hypothetical protein
MVDWKRFLCSVRQVPGQTFGPVTVTQCDTSSSPQISARTAPQIKPQTPPSTSSPIHWSLYRSTLYNMSYWKRCQINKQTDKVKKGKAIPVRGRGGPYGWETSRLPHFLDNRFTDGGEAVSLTLRKIPGTHLFEAESTLEPYYGWMDWVN